MALTFDGGPHTSTEQIITELLSFGVKATFHVDTTKADYYASVVKKIHGTGNIVGLRWPDKYKSAIMTDEEIVDVLLTGMIWYRFLFFKVFGSQCSVSSLFLFSGI